MELKRNPLISIIVPVYNTERYLTECLNSIVHQTYTNIEIIIVDDASTDNSCKIITTFQCKDSRIKYIRHNINRGICQARNTGLSHCNGEYIAWCDSDDVLHPSFIECLYTYLTMYDADFIECQSISDFKYEPNLLDVLGDIKVTIGDANDFLIRFATHKLQTSLWSKMFKKNLFDQFRFPIGRLYEENYFYTVLYYRLNKAVYISAPLYFYRKRLNSIMNTFRIRELKEGLMVVILFINFASQLHGRAKKIFQQKALKILIGYWQRIAAINATLTQKIKCIKLIARFMRKTDVTPKDVKFFTRKEQFFFIVRNSSIFFFLYYLFRKYIKHNIV